MATAVGDDMKDGSASLLDFNSLSINEDGGAPASEDVAWADSCLIKDIGVSDNSLDPFRDALPETFHSQLILMGDGSPQESVILPSIKQSGISEILDDTIDDVSLANEQEGNSALMGDGSSQESVIIPSIKQSGISNILDDTTDDISLTNEHEGNNTVNNDDKESFWAGMNLEDVLLPTYNEDLRYVPDSDSDLELPIFVEENYVEDIFKVWELDIPDEEDELVKQLKKALLDSSLKSTLTASDKLIDDLISALGDLSLRPPSD